MTSQPNPFAPHWLIRDIVIGAHRSAAGPGGLLLVGDSIVEGFYWNRIGPLAVLNAGYSGIWTEALEPRVPRLIEAARPSLVVLLVGANDAKKGCTEHDLDAVAGHYESIVRHSDVSGIPFILMTPPPVEPGRRLTSFYSTEAMASLSRRIVGIAKAHETVMIDLHRALSDGTGQARAGLTIDGIHLSAEGYRLMHDLLQQAVMRHKAGG